jgi:BirA family transcriptional regulator, biotin operon repressor / biotin---[acetyl-CoA-carboxylase] ligase
VRDISKAPVRRHATLDSTNSEARRLFDAGERGPLWILADEQTAGRGRLARNWVSAKGNCYSTLLLPVTDAGMKVPQIAFVVALAVADTVRELTPTARVVLKWPNDCLVDGAKIAGILCEVLNQDPLTVAIGCGINVTHAPLALAYPATCLAALGSSASRDEVFAGYSLALSNRMSTWNNGAGFSMIRQAWLTYALGVGERVSMTVGQDTLQGVLEGLADDGALLLKLSDRSTRVFHAGDLRIPSLEKLRTMTA